MTQLDPSLTASVTANITSTGDPNVYIDYGNIIFPPLTAASSATVSISPNYSYNWNIGSITTPLDVHGDAHIEGDTNIEGDLKVKGKSILESLEKIEERLAIMHPNVELEEKWENLRELRNQYVELERQIIEQERVWGILGK